MMIVWVLSLTPPANRFSIHMCYHGQTVRVARDYYLLVLIKSLHFSKGAASVVVQRTSDWCSCYHSTESLINLTISLSVFLPFQCRIRMQRNLLAAHRLLQLQCDAQYPTQLLSSQGECSNLGAGKFQRNFVIRDARAHWNNVLADKEPNNSGKLLIILSQKLHWLDNSPWVVAPLRYTFLPLATFRKFMSWRGGESGK